MLSTCFPLGVENFQEGDKKQYFTSSTLAKKKQFEPREHRKKQKKRIISGFALMIFENLNEGY